MFHVSDTSHLLFSWLRLNVKQLNIQSQEKVMALFLHKLVIKCGLIFTKVTNIYTNNISKLIKHKQSGSWTCFIIKMVDIYVCLKKSLTMAYWGYTESSIILLSTRTKSDILQAHYKKLTSQLSFHGRSCCFYRCHFCSCSVYYSGSKGCQGLDQRHCGSSTSSL